VSYAGGERAFHKTAWGKQSTQGLAVPTTALLGGDSTGMIVLDRSPDNIQEDYGRLSMHEAGRGSYGVRHATLARKGVVRFEDVMPALAGCIAGGVTATGADTDKTRLYAADMTNTTLDLATIEEGDNINVYQMPDALLTDITLAFSDLAAPGNAPWTISENWIGSDKISVGGFTSAAVAPSVAETAMGHLTRAYFGSTATAFASLSENVGLHGCSVNIPSGVVPRKYGNAGDVLDGYGRARREPKGTFTLFATAANQAALFDGAYVTAGTVMGEKRLRTVCLGSAIAGTNESQSLTLTGSPTGGTFTLTFGAQTTGVIALNASAATVQAALRALTTIGQYGCVVTGSDGGPYLVTFNGILGNIVTPGAITATTTGLTPSGGMTIAEATPGVLGIYKSLIIDGRIRFRAVPVAESAGATVFQTDAEYVYDATLGTDIAVTLVNTIA
jgi:hypothetical protein